MILDSGLEIIAPKALICSKSKYIDNACSEQDQIAPRLTNIPKKHEGRLTGQKQPENEKPTDAPDSAAWQPTVANTIRIHHVGATIFSIFLAWAVTGALEEAEHFIVDACESRDRMCSKTLQLIECYILGEKIRAEDFKNQVIDHILAHENRLLDEYRASSLVSNVVDLVYHKTPAESPLRRFMVDLTVFTIPKDLASLIPDQNPNVEYIRDCFREYQRAMSSSRESLRSPWEKHACDYHDHSDRPLGYRCRQ